jgi:hypothetical protein
LVITCGMSQQALKKEMRAVSGSTGPEAALGSAWCSSKD